MSLSVLPIIENLKVQANTEFLVTTVTYSSGKLAEEKLKKFKNIHHRYFPVDITFVIEKFIKLWGPKAVFFSRVRNLAKSNFYFKKI